MAEDRTNAARAVLSALGAFALAAYQVLPADPSKVAELVTRAERFAEGYDVNGKLLWNDAEMGEPRSSARALAGAMRAGMGAWLDPTSLQSTKDATRANIQAVGVRLAARGVAVDPTAPAKGDYTKVDAEAAKAVNAAQGDAQRGELLERARALLLDNPVAQWFNEQSTAIKVLAGVAVGVVVLSSVAAVVSAVRRP